MTRFAGAPVSVAVLLAAGTAARAAEPLRREITTSGQAVVRAVPDEVLVTAGVETFDPLLDRARQDNNDQCRRLLQVVKEMGVREDDIATDVLQVHLEYKVRDDPAKGVEGYHARRSYSILVRDLGRLEALIDAMLKNGANRLEDLQFKTSKLRTHRDEARRLAVRAAHEKAQALAAELGMKVGSPVSIQEEEANTGWSWSANRIQNVSVAVDGFEGGGAVILPGGRIEVRAGVRVAFELAAIDEGRGRPVLE